MSPQRTASWKQRQRLGIVGAATPSWLLHRMVATCAASDDAPMPAAQRDVLMMVFLSAITAVQAGRRPGPHEWDSLSDAINTVECLVELGRIPRAEVADCLAGAITGMHASREQWREVRGMRMSAEHITAVREVIDVYAQALEGLPERDIKLAQVRVQEHVSRQIAERRSATT